MKIMLFAPSGAVSSAIDQIAPGTDDEIVVISRVKPDADVRAAVITPALTGMTRWAERVLGGSAAGRNLLRITPLDAGRRFAGATRRSRRLREELADTALIVVLDRDGILAGWHAARRAAPQVPAVYGIPAGRGALEALRS